MYDPSQPPPEGGVDHSHPATPTAQAPQVVVVQDAQPAVEAEPRKRSSAGPKWEVEARERVKAGIRRFAKPLNDLIERDANEGDTRMLVNRILTDVLGYDEFSELTTEYAVKGEFADYGIRIDRDLVAFVEVKRVATKLGAKHLRQAEMYAVNEGVEWIVLTNGADWRAYHLSAGLPVEIDLALEVNLLGDETGAQKAAQLFYLTRESLKRHQLDEVWKAKRATSPKSLAKVLSAPSVAEAIRKELRRSTKQNVNAVEITRLLRETVIRPECLEKT
jgi:predicted type IV restriction endonuclease